MWFGLRRLFADNEISNVTDAVMFKQLAQMKYKPRNGKLAIESKAEMKSRGIDSPDRAEALCYAFANSTAQQLSDEETEREPVYSKPAYLKARKPAYLTGMRR